MPDDLLRSEAEARVAVLSDISYDVTLDLTGGSDAATFASVTEIEFASVEGASTFVDLETDIVHEIVLNGTAIDTAAHTQNRIELSGLLATNRLRVVADCSYSHTGMGLHRIVDPADDHVYIYTQCEPFEGHRVFACFDQPDLKARFVLRVHAPSGWTVVSNAPVDHIDSSAENVSTVVFKRSPIMSTYLVAIVAGPYARVTDSHDGVELNLYCRQSLQQYLEDQEIFEITKQGLDHFTQRFGMPYPFGEKYDQLFVPEFNAGAMENVACVTFNEESAIYRGAVPAAVRAWRAGTILHEMAHMWFGDLVTMRWWNDLWLNESFATYMGNDAQANATKFTSAWVNFANGDKSWAARQDQLPTTHPIAADVPDVSTGRLNFDGISYAKGASVLRQLVAWVGEDAFFGGIREYFTKHQWSNATLGDFLAPLESHSGRDLAAWSREWLETAGMNVLRVEIEASDGIIQACSVVQTPAVESLDTLRSHRIGIGLFDLDDDGRLVRTERIELDVSGARTGIPQMQGRARPALLLPNDGDLTFAKIRLDDVSTQTVIDHLSDLEDPLARSLLWAAMWDTARDAEVPATRYIELVQRHAPAETLPTIIDDLLAQAMGAVENFAHPDNRRAARARLHEMAALILSSAAPGSPGQLSALRCTLATAGSPEDYDVAAGLLSGRSVPEGITVDQDLRWMITRRLAAAGRLDDGAIDAEAGRDKTDVGARKAAAARAARPDAEAKAAAWTRIIDPATPLAMQRALIGGIQERDQQALMTPYIQMWVDQVPGYWRERASEEAELFTLGMYPAYRADDAVISAADELLRDRELSDAGRRLVAESRDSTLRQQRAQAADRATGVGAGA
ncbi:MAG: aminopeptidase N [Candidatus Dormibacteraeota bacterium]|uniref:Aminopeptidase N n=1 Tax=Candidatus Amunia macphersoniae TaxID=3127014 RepID=A0A934NJJ3_9BACT|nr:aminopeptidase N [Candidatus Dormibacteraeota bacterium]